MAGKPTSICRVVAFGGGTGITSLLSGLRCEGDVDVCAVVTVADDGGSSGRLRREFGIPPPGDIRNCLVALSEAEPLVRELFQYRFGGSFLKDHSFGNLFLAALTGLTGDFRLAIERARGMLSVRGNVIPFTDQKVALVAEHPDGSKSTGEQSITTSGKRVSDIHLVPEPPGVSDEILGYLERADMVCLGPGSLYTSIIPNLLVPGMIKAINESKAMVVLVGNLMTQPGETDGFDLAAHVEALLRINPGLEIDCILGRDDEIDSVRVDRYSLEKSVPVEFSGLDSIEGTPVVRIECVEQGEHVRHDPERLAQGLLDLVGGGKRPGKRG